MMQILASLFISGLLFGWGPCLASCGPVLLSYVAGTHKNVFSGLRDYALFSAARLSVYFVLALVIFFTGKLTLERFLGRHAQYVFFLGGAFLIFIGLATALGKRMELKLWPGAKGIPWRNSGNPIVLGFIMGLLPCAPLLALFSYIGLVSRSWLDSLLYSMAFGLGTFLSPLIVLIILSGFLPKLLVSRQAVYGRIFSLICGLIIVFLGVQLIFRGFL